MRATTWHKDALRSFAATSSSRLSNSEQLCSVLGESHSFNFTRVMQEGQPLNGLNAAYVSRNIQKLCPLLLSAFVCVI